MADKNLIEAKNAQLQQIRENEARREAERELEGMWHDLTMKEYKAKVCQFENQIGQITIFNVTVGSRGTGGN